MSKRKICIVTGSRAEYGLLYWLIKEVEADQDLELQLIVTGSHLSSEFGLTKSALEIFVKIKNKIANLKIIFITYFRLVLVHHPHISQASI